MVELRKEPEPLNAFRHSPHGLKHAELEERGFLRNEMSLRPN